MTNPLLPTNNNVSNKDHSDHAEASNKSSWIGCWVNKPEGEWDCKSQDGCQGWGKPEILEMAGIMEEQYSMYLVRVSITLAAQLTGCFTQKSVHQLCDHYFNITMGFNKNCWTYPDEYKIIINMICHIFFILISICWQQSRWRSFICNFSSIWVIGSPSTSLHIARLCCRHSPGLVLTLTSLPTKTIWMRQTRTKSSKVSGGTWLVWTGSQCCQDQRPVLHYPHCPDQRSVLHSPLSAYWCSKS